MSVCDFHYSDHIIILLTIGQLSENVFIYHICNAYNNKLPKLLKAD